ncbi:acetylornithine transaminase [Ancrocorticia populi]|uniref:acetylornithine transaminase n=2 Tax=Ancrocorticia populi TaxID=2175228 RepID=UPI002354F42B|nr:acetylornithine transaminase [Ancrocorticia populi]
MSTNETMINRYSRAFMNTFGPPQLALVRGEGTYVWDLDGRRYLDLLGGIAVNALGHAHPALVAAATNQVGTLGHISNFFTSPAQVELGEKIQDVFTQSGYAEPAKVFLTNSGTEAIEAALKLTRLHKPEGRVLALSHSFHGRTFGALTLTDKPAIKDQFAPLAGSVEFVEPSPEALDAAFAPGNVAAIFMEPIQGEVGVMPLPAGLLAHARRLCDDAGALLVIDEIQTGVGRTGQWLASAGVQADVVTLAKGLGGGFPIGACVGVGATGELFTPGSHGSTFAGNPVASAVALATLTEVEGLLGHVGATGDWLISELSAAGYSVRGEGLLIGIAVSDGPAIRDRLLGQGIIVNAPNPTTIRLAPPLIITKADLAPFFTIMAEYAREFQES